VTTPADSQQRVRRLENDVESIYDLLGGIKETQEQHGSQLGNIASSLTRVEAAQLLQGKLLEALTSKLAEHDDNFRDLSGHQATFDAAQQLHGGRLDALESNLDEHSAKLDEHFGGDTAPAHAALIAPRRAWPVITTDDRAAGFRSAVPRSSFCPDPPRPSCHTPAKGSPAPGGSWPGGV
jgi:hypothetical protein